jgi:hypothetical protein
MGPGVDTMLVGLPGLGLPGVRVEQESMVFVSVMVVVMVKYETIEEGLGSAGVRVRTTGEGVGPLGAAGEE